jgi:hypothetical protein
VCDFRAIMFLEAEEASRNGLVKVLGITRLRSLSLCRVYVWLQNEKFMILGFLPFWPEECFQPRLSLL